MTDYTTNETKVTRYHPMRDGDEWQAITAFSLRGNLCNKFTKQLEANATKERRAS